MKVYDKWISYYNYSSDTQDFYRISISQRDNQTLEMEMHWLLNSMNSTFQFKHSDFNASYFQWIFSAKHEKGTGTKSTPVVEITDVKLENGLNSEFKMLKQRLEKASKLEKTDNLRNMLAILISIFTFCVISVLAVGYCTLCMKKEDQTSLKLQIEMNENIKRVETENNQIINHI